MAHTFLDTRYRLNSYISFSWLSIVSTWQHRMLALFQAQHFTFFRERLWGNPHVLDRKVDRACLLDPAGRLDATDISPGSDRDG
jgi:hypothetical protein